jgi:hypothetical protein
MFRDPSKAPQRSISAYDPSPRRRGLVATVLDGIVLRWPEARRVQLIGTHHPTLSAALMGIADVEVTEPSDFDQTSGRFDVIVFDGALDGLAEPRALLRRAYDATTVETGIVTVARDDRVRNADRTRSRRDLVTSSLFAEGFVGTRTKSARDGVATFSERGHLAPPWGRPITLSVILPVFNERETFHKVMEQLSVKEIPGIEMEIVIVESNSTDGTRDEVLSFESDRRVTVVLEDRPNGKGHAVRAGFDHASGELVVIQDADLEYDLDDYERVLAPLRSFETSFVLGSRTRTNGARFGVRHFEKQVLAGLFLNLGNVLFLRLFNTVYRQKLADPFTMYKAFRRECLDGLALESNRFDLDWELTGKLIRSGYEPVEIPVSYESRSFSEGKKVSLVRDPISWVRACVKYRISRLDT